MRRSATDRERGMDLGERLGRNRQVIGRISEALEHMAQEGTYSGELTVSVHRGVAGKIAAHVTTGPALNFELPSAAPDRSTPPPRAAGEDTVTMTRSELADRIRDAIASGSSEE